MWLEEDKLTSSHCFFSSKERVKLSLAKARATGTFKFFIKCQERLEMKCNWWNLFLHAKEVALSFNITYFVPISQAGRFQRSIGFMEVMGICSYLNVWLWFNVTKWSVEVSNRKCKEKDGTKERKFLKM